MGNSDVALQQRLRQDDQRALEEVYQKYRQAFLQYGMKWKLNEADILDVYQDAAIIMHQQFVTRQIVLEGASVKTYLFGIGKNLLMRKIKQKTKVNSYHTVAMEDEVEEMEWEAEEVTTEQKKLALYFAKLGAKCQEILKLFYYQGFSIKEIVQFSHYKDENTVKSQKSRCLKRLKQLINTAS